MAVTAPVLLTVDEFAQRPERADGWREELVRGQIVTSPPPSFFHGFVQVNVAVPLWTWARSERRGRLTTGSGLQTEKNPDSVRGPDVAYWSAERLPLDVVPAVYPVAADLCVEVRSPGDRRGEIEDKVREYLAASVRVVWIVDPAARTVTVFRRPDAGAVFETTATLTDLEVLPGFSCRVGEFFE